MSVLKKEKVDDKELQDLLIIYKQLPEIERNIVMAGSGLLLASQISREQKEKEEQLCKTI